MTLTETCPSCGKTSLHWNEDQIRCFNCGAKFSLENFRLISELVRDELKRSNLIASNSQTDDYIVDVVVHYALLITFPIGIVAYLTQRILGKRIIEKQIQQQDSAAVQALAMSLAKTFPELDQESSVLLAQRILIGVINTSNVIVVQEIIMGDKITKNKNSIIINRSTFAGNVDISEEKLDVNDFIKALQELIQKNGLEERLSPDVENLKRELTRSEGSAPVLTRIWNGLVEAAPVLNTLSDTAAKIIALYQGGT